ncbi:testis-specific gene 10 protein [Protopterus annectens]|uniref:testis-specific gene 10 protein n=1 Tax=Protopterus annectens TaxID=7888 RepID=UPI001CFA8C50|nr:testis-specific gene 10 protein [Protopterus annectens]
MTMLKKNTAEQKTLETSPDRNSEASEHVTELAVKNRTKKTFISQLNVKIECPELKSHDPDRQLHHLLETTETLTTPLELHSCKNEQPEKWSTTYRLKEDLVKTKDLLQKIASSERKKAKHARKLHDHLGNTEAELRSKEQENKTLNILLEQLEEEKQRLARKAERIETSEKELFLVVERGRQRIPKRTSSLSRLDAFVKSLEEDKGYYRSEVERLRKMMRSKASSPKRNVSHGRSPVRTSPVKGGTYESEIMQVIRERDEYQSLIHKYERHLAEIQANVKILTNERDKANRIYEQAQEEINRLRRDLIKSPKTPKSTITAQHILRRVEAERDEAMADLRRMTTERDSLRERLKISQETYITEKASMEQRIEDLQGIIARLENGRVENKSKQSSLKELIHTLEEDMRMLSSKLLNTENELARQKGENNSLRIIKDKVESSFADTEHHLSQKTTELECALEKLEVLEEKISELKMQNLAQREEIRTFRITVARLDKERDSLQQSLDEKTEKISSLNELLGEKEKSMSEMRLNITEIRATAGQLNEAVSHHEREISRLRQQLDETNEELTNTGRAQEIAMRENDKLQDQLSKAKQENQELKKQLESTLQKVQTLTLKLQDSQTNMSRMDAMLAAKEKENRELQDSYRKVSVEAEKLESKVHQTEGDNSSMKLELCTAESECRRMKERTETLEKEVKEVLTSRDTCQSQISNLNKVISGKENELHQIQSENNALFKELSSTKELLAKVDTNKEVAIKQLTLKGHELERVATELGTAQTEISLLRKQLSSERMSMKNLETLLISNREKEIQSQMSNQEKNSEIQLLRDRLLLADNKIVTQSREMAQLRSRTAQVETELDITKRQLSTERLEREHAVQELRRQGTSVSYLTSSPIGRTSLSPSTRSPESAQLLSLEQRSRDRSLDISISSRTY